MDGWFYRRLSLGFILFREGGREYWRGGNLKHFFSVYPTCM